MGVKKYKPTHTPRSLDESLIEAEQKAKSAVAQAREAIARSEKLKTESDQVVERAKRLCGKD